MTIRGSWNLAFQTAVPAYEQKIMALAEPAWQTYGTMLARRSLRRPDARLEHDPRIQNAIEIGKGVMKTRVREILKTLVIGATHVHPVFRHEVKQSMIPVFEKAEAIKGKCSITQDAWWDSNSFTGNGTRAKRDKVLRAFIKKNSESLFREASERMEAVHLENMHEAAKMLEELARPSVSRVEKLVQPLFGLRKAVGSPASQNARRQFLKENDHVLASWMACWQNPSSQRDDHVMRGDMNIPEPLGLFNAENDAQAPVIGVGN